MVNPAFHAGSLAARADPRALSQQGHAHKSHTKENPSRGPVSPPESCAGAGGVQGAACPARGVGHGLQPYGGSPPEP